MKFHTNNIVETHATASSAQLWQSYTDCETHLKQKKETKGKYIIFFFFFFLMKCGIIIKSLICTNENQTVGNDNNKNNNNYNNVKSDNGFRMH